MTILDGELGEVIRCDRCRKVHDYDHSDFEIRLNIWGPLFKGRPWPDFGGDFCEECAKEITPLVFQLRDVDELKLFVNKLERAIREKRNQRT